MQPNCFTEGLLAQLNKPLVQSIFIFAALFLLSASDCWAMTSELKDTLEKNESLGYDIARIVITGALAIIGARATSSGNPTTGIIGFISAFATWAGMSWMKTAHPIMI